MKEDIRVWNSASWHTDISILLIQDPPSFALRHSLTDRSSLQPTNVRQEQTAVRINRIRERNITGNPRVTPQRHGS